MNWFTLLKTDLNMYRMTPGNMKRLLLGMVLRSETTALALIRAEQALHTRNHRVLAEVVRSILHWRTGMDFVPGFQVGASLSIPHPVGIVVGRGVIAGTGLKIMQNVTLGEGHIRLDDADGLYPRLGNDVVVGAGACVLGPVIIGHRVSIAANAVVLSDVPDDAVVAGAPAVVVGYAAGRQT